jgi:hypothetical protein
MAADDELELVVLPGSCSTRKAIGNSAAGAGSGVPGGML